ncbi:MAG: DNA-directed RNA polymerase subunit beta [Proteobacteria bacterium]|nr:DNA-directed RNA polymerase subunit beta [Pseudomonadota bacterium]
MTKNLFYGRIRKDFGKIPSVLDVPYLLDIQKRSYQNFIDKDLGENKRKRGLLGAFLSVFPITDYSGKYTIEFVDYTLMEPKFNEEEARTKGVSYAAPIKIKVRLLIRSEEDGKVGDVITFKEQEIYFGEIPLMTENGTFIINGAERVIVNQLHRSPGVFFEEDKQANIATGKRQFTARIIPIRGSWLDFEFDQKDILFVRIDRKKRFLVTTFLKALGLTSEQILNTFYKSEKIIIEDGKIYKTIVPEVLEGLKASYDVVSDKGEVVIKKSQKFTRGNLKKVFNAKIDKIQIKSDEIIGSVLANSIKDEVTGEEIPCNTVITEKLFDDLIEKGIKEFKIITFNGYNMSHCISETLILDEKIRTKKDALLEIYKKMKPNEPATEAVASEFFYGLFFDPDKYDLSPVGRLKLNFKFNLNVPVDNCILCQEDIVLLIQHLVALKNGKGSPDDIDNLGNRRVRTVGELVENQFRMGLVRMEKMVKERMSILDMETVMPQDVVNPKPVMAVLKEFFGSSQLSQFMDQTNPLSEITHKRRLSALGPGGLQRERAGFEVRDVHPTHYGRICPIETPEGQNIGLITSISTFARINEYGFIETPYRVVKDGVVTDEVKYLSALEEERHIIAQANASLDEKGRFKSELILARQSGEFVSKKPEEVTYMDVSPKQVVSVAASLIPFLEHDDANRALMGSNMQRQAVPLLNPEAPIVGTGMEYIVARDSGAVVIAKRDGVVESVDATRIVIKPDNVKDDKEDSIDIYNLIKFRKTNQNTCINQKPIVNKGQYVKKGQIIANGFATDGPELALGRNVLVAFMPWEGYNFEDSIIISERLVKEDVFTSIHIEEFEVAARDTKLGKEEITKDIPNVGEDVLKNLDTTGIVKIGAEIKPNDILVGKITPKGETQLTPEEKLMKAIFADKGSDYKDTSLKVPSGIHGVVIDTKVFSRKGVEKDDRLKELEEKEYEKIARDRDDEIRILKDTYYDKIKKLLIGKKVANKIVDEDGNVLLQKGKEITEEVLQKIPFDEWENISLHQKVDYENKIKNLFEKLRDQIELVEMLFKDKINKLKKGDELPPGVLKLVKIYIAIKRKISPGDKMAGRHGNKGVVSIVVPEEDMPFLKDGSPVDMVLNPLGVPSRMNVGQILETHLGWAAKGLGNLVNDYLNSTSKKLREFLKELYETPQAKKIIDTLTEEELYNFAREVAKKGLFMSTPVFEGATEQEIKKLLKKAGLPESGQVTLYDGKTGEPFHQKVTVGYMYMLKLHHLVDDKVHARSTGPYSLVTQQPLGGKAHFGGQRLGEMEVWALEAYGAAYTLQEFLTVKSDDLVGRSTVYQAIVKGNNVPEPGIPESFNVLLKELRSLALDIELLKIEEEQD